MNNINKSACRIGGREKTAIKIGKKGGGEWQHKILLLKIVHIKKWEKMIETNRKRKNSKIINRKERKETTIKWPDMEK